ncbi:hypothetical protein GX831_02850, partial [bacterium]|nr:hypothetical protein [bacterium]
YKLKNTLEYDNIVSWFTNAAAISLMFIPLVFLLSGFVGINTVFSNPIPILYILATLSLGYVTIFIDDSNFLSNISFEKLKTFDRTAFLVIFFVFCLLTLMNFDRIDPRWDTFTYWGIDAKYIFENGQLRGPDFNVLWRFEYTSFIPILISTIYKFYNNILEQYASWINVFVVYVSMNLVYTRLSKTSLISKFVGLIFLIWAVYGSIEAAYMFSLYADIYCAFIVLIFGLVLIKPFKPILEPTSQRSFMLAITLLLLYFIKEPYIHISFILLLVWFLFDFWVYKGKVIGLAKTRSFWILMLVIVIILTLRWLYFDTIGNINYHDSLIPKLAARESLNDYIEYLSKIFLFFMRHYPYTLIIWTLGFGTIIIKKPTQNKPTFYAVYAICFLVSAFFILGYTIQKSSFTSGSISRYISLVTFLIPMLPALALPTVSEKNDRSLVDVVLLALFIFIAIVKIMIPMPLLREFSLKPGAYQDSALLKNSYVLAQNVIDITGENAKILITDDLVWGGNRNIISNTNEPAIYVRYYLLNQSVGAQYNLDESMLFSYALESDADYILMLNNDFLFDDCEGIFKTSGNFLLKLDNIDSEFANCNLLKNNVIPLE